MGAGGLVVLALAIATRASLMPHAWLDLALLLYLRVALLAGSIYLVFNGVTLDDRLSFLGNRSGLRETATGSHKRRLPPARHPRTA